MTRVVVQRSQGSTSSANSRASSLAVSVAPTPPPLPPSSSTQPSSCLPCTSSVSNSEEDSREPKECELLICEDLPSSFHYPDGKAKESTFSEDDNALADAVANDECGREIFIASRYNMISEEVEKELSDSSRPCEAGSPNEKFATSGDSGAIGFEVEQMMMQSEDLGFQKLPMDVRSEGSFQGDDEDKSNGLHSKSEGVLLPPLFQTDGTAAGLGGFPSHIQGASDQNSSSISWVGMESGSKLTETTAGLSLPAVSASSGMLPTSKRGGLGGSPPSSGFRAAGGSSRKVWRSIKSSKSPPHNSRSSSPRSYAEGDGYNSADEQNPWALGQRGFEDNDDRERQFEIEIRRSRGLEVRRMAEDGNCLFRAVADQVYGDPEMYSETRQMCIDYMEKERDHFSQFVTESFSAYCKRKRRDKVFGNNLEIQAMAEMYNRPIHIFCYGTEPKNIFQGNYETDLPPIRLSYHRSNHYNSLIDPSRPTVGAGLGFGSLQGANIDRDQVKAAIKAQQDLQIDKALLAEGRFNSDLEWTEQEMERMVIEASRAEFLAEEYGHQIGCVESSTSAAGTSTSQGDTLDHRLQSAWHGSSAASFGSPPPAANTSLTTNMRILLSMGFSYFRVVESCDIFGDDINDMLCYLLEAETGGLFEDSVYRMKGKAAER